MGDWECRNFRATGKAGMGATVGEQGLQLKPEAIFDLSTYAVVILLGISITMHTGDSIS
jgi:hypothetical protein